MALSERDKEELYASQEGKCMYCGWRLRRGDMQVDHKIPKSKNGPAIKANSQYLCSMCNNLKSDLTDMQFRRRARFILGLPTSGRGARPPSKPISHKYLHSAVKGLPAPRGIDVRCPRCRAEPGHACVTSGGFRHEPSHSLRKEASIDRKSRRRA